MGRNVEDGEIVLSAERGFGCLHKTDGGLTPAYSKYNRTPQVFIGEVLDFQAEARSRLARAIRSRKPGGKSGWILRASFQSASVCFR